MHCKTLSQETTKKPQTKTTMITTKKESPFYSNLTLGVYPKELKAGTQTYLFAHVHIGIEYDSQM
jgi:hypothetical protein